MSPNLIGQSLGRYHILEQLGEGGMATVYKAYDTRLERDVAVKIIRKTAFSAEILENVLARFEREAKSLAKLSHPNIVKVHDYGDHEGSPYLVLEYLSGGTLKQSLGKPLSWQAALQLILPIARGLAYAHQRGIIHRDVKPANILITESGEPLLSDFGIAKLLEKEDGRTLTGSGVGIGTPEYMAPEQGAGQAVDARADIYSLGIVLYEMVTGRKPFTADTPMAVVLKQLTDPLPRPTDFNPEIPVAVENLLIKALAKDPQNRYDSMDDFIKALETCLTEMPASAKSLPVVTPSAAVADEETVRQVTAPGAMTQQKASSRNVWWILAAAFVIVAIVLGGIWGWPRLAAMMQNPTPVPTLEQPTVPPQPEPTEPVATPTQSQTAPVKKGTTITIWYSYAARTAEETALLGNIKRARAAFPDLQIVAQPVAFTDIFTLYRQEVTAGDGPDMFLAPNDSLGDEARAGLLADISLNTIAKLGNYYPSALDGMKVDKTIYGIPESFKAVSLYYNRALMPKPPATTADLKKIMQAGTPVGMSFGCYWQFGFYGAFGGQIFDPDWRVIADQGGVVDALDYLNGLYKISVAKGWPVDYVDGLRAFASGKTAAVIDGNWTLGEYRAALGNNLAVAPIPAGPKGPASPLLGVDGFFFNPKSANIPVAVDIALFLTNPDSETEMMRLAGHVPVRNDVTVTDPLVKTLVDAFQTGYLRPQAPEFQKYWNNFCNTDDVFVKGVPARDWIRAATEAANR